MTDDHRTNQGFLQEVQLGIGTWAWGDRLIWGFGNQYSKKDILEVFRHAVESGIRFFDTAETYGQGKSEELLGSCIAETGEQVDIATKFSPFPWRLSRKSLISALKGSLKRLGLNQISLLQIHYPLPPITIETWMDAMSDAVQAGLTQSVGVSNYDLEQLQRAYDALIRLGVPLASNQVEFHLLNRKIEKEGMIKRAQELGIRIIAYSPLSMGLLTGKYTPDNPPPGFRGSRYNKKYLSQIEPMIHALRRVGGDRGGKTPAQVAINWVLCKGVIPIVGVKTIDQLEQNLGGLGWKLTDEEVHFLDETSDKINA